MIEVEFNRFPGAAAFADGRYEQAHWAMHAEPAHRDPVDYGDAARNTVSTPV